MGEIQGMLLLSTPIYIKKKGLEEQLIEVIPEMVIPVSGSH